MKSQMHFPKRIPEPAHMTKLDFAAFEALARKNYGKWFTSIADEALKEANIQKSGVVVEIGSGPGFLLKEIASRSAHFAVIGVDPSSHALSLARKNCKELKNVQLLKGRAEKLPLKTGTVDLLISKDSFHEYLNPHATLREMMRVLKSGGIAYIRDLRRDIPWKILKDAVPPKTPLQKLRYYSTRAAYTKDEIKKFIIKLKIRSYRLTNLRLTAGRLCKYRRFAENREDLARTFATRLLLVVRKL